MPRFAEVTKVYLSHRHFYLAPDVDSILRQCDVWKRSVGKGSVWLDDVLIFDVLSTDAITDFYLKNIFTSELQVWTKPNNPIILEIQSSFRTSAAARKF